MLLQDQLKRKLEFSKTPKRIVSLVPSQTELLVDLGLKENLVGITKFCVHPQNLRKEITVVGGTKQVKLEKIKAANPDIILCNKEENTQEIVSELEKIAPVHVSDIYTLEDSFEMIRQYGKLFSVEEKANEIVENIQIEFQSFQEYISHKPIRKVAYFIWKNPWMVAGGDTFIDYLLRLNRFENVFQNTTRYPEIDLNSLPDLDLVLLSSEPFPFSEKHLKYFSGIVSTEKIHFVDGEYFSWYGSRMLGAFRYFRKLHKTLDTEK